MVPGNCQLHIRRRDFFAVGQHDDLFAAAGDTFFVANQQGGVMGLTAGLGACKSGDCKFNKNYECTVYPPPFKTVGLNYLSALSEIEL